MTILCKKHFPSQLHFSKYEILLSSIFVEWQLLFHRNLPWSKTSSYILNDKYFCKEAITVPKRYLLECFFTKKTVFGIVFRLRFEMSIFFTKKTSLEITISLPRRPFVFNRRFLILKPCCSTKNLWNYNSLSKSKLRSFFQMTTLPSKKPFRLYN